MMRKRRKWK